MSKIKKVFEELEKFFVEKDREDSFTIFSAEYFDIKKKFEESEN